MCAWLPAEARLALYRGRLAYGLGFCGSDFAVYESGFAVYESGSAVYESGSAICESALRFTSQAL